MCKVYYHSILDVPFDYYFYFFLFFPSFFFAHFTLLKSHRMQLSFIYLMEL